jgi:hypothetical protein
LRTAIAESSPEVGKTLDADKSMRAELSSKELSARGYDFFHEVYGKVTDRVLNNMGLSSGGDLSEFALHSIYGELMAETRILSAKETGLLEFVICYACAAAPQAKG